MRILSAAVPLIALFILSGISGGGVGDSLPQRVVIYTTYATQREATSPITESAIEILGAWDKAELSVLLVPTSDERLNRWAMEGMKWWSTAIPVFTALYGYGYLDSLKIRTYVQGVNGSSGDIVVRFVDTLGGRVCGVTEIDLPYGARIVGADIRLSLSCIDGRGEVARIVAAHELAHALGLGHTDDCSDIMCEHVVFNSRPSTLDVYGLAVAYSWMESGGFRPPPAEASLPASIPMMKLLDAYGLPIKMRVNVYRSVDGGAPELLEELVVEPGKSIQLSAEEAIYIAQDQRIRFVGWMVGAEEIGGREITITPRSHLSVIQRYSTQYFVNVSTAIDEGIEGWYDKGSSLEVSLPSMIQLDNKSRLRFGGWRGSLEVLNSTLRIVVEAPIRLEAVWVKQYLVEVASPFGSVIGGGWLDEGSEARITIEPSIIDLGNATRLALRGFTGDVESGNKSLSISIDGPKFIEARWATQYLVDVSSTHGGVGGPRWVDAGSLLTISAKEVIEWPNGTRALFSEWRGDVSSKERELSLVVNRPARLVASYQLEYLVTVSSDYPVAGKAGWYRPGEAVLYTAPEVVHLSNSTRAVFIGWSGDITTSNLTISSTVSSPLTLSANWRLEHLVKLHYPEPLRDSELWLAEGAELQLSAPLLVPVSPVEMLEFKEWRGTYNESSPVLRLTVTQPVELEAAYWKLHRVRVIEEPSLEGLERASFRLEGPGGIILMVNGGDEAWLREGPWRVVEAVWRGADVTADGSVPIRGGLAAIPVDMRSLSVKVVDIFGLPVPGAPITISRSNGLAEASGTTGLDGYAELWPVSRAASSLEAHYPFMSGSSRLSGEERELVSTLPLGAYSLLLIVGIAAISIMALHKNRGRRPTPPQRQPGW